MAWLNFTLPLTQELEVEKQARAIRNCDDIDELRCLAEQLFRMWCQQADLTAQLIHQVAGAEALLAQAGVAEPLDQEYLTWASAINPETWGS